MIAYILRRIVLAIPVMIGILFLTFLLSRLIPGDPCRAMLGEKATQAVCDAFVERTGLNQPIPVQFAYYFGRAVTGDLGESLRFGRPVTDMLMERLPVTVELALLSLLVATFVGMTLGVVAAYWQNSPIDAITMVFANLGVSVPIFVLGLLAAYLFAVAFKDTPFALPPSGRLQPGLIVKTIPEAWGMEDLGGLPRTLLDFLSQMYVVNGILTLNWKVASDAARHLILPVFVLATVPMSIIARMTRSSLLEVMTLDYMRTARAKGLNERHVVFRHAMRNSLLPVVTVVGLSLGGLLSGAVLTETIFGLTGVGRTLFDAITSRDYIVIQGFTLAIAFIYVFVNLLVDLSYAVLDPRIRLS
ncbi:MAG: ABC transporter permease [Caldilineaceae bacterium]|nr:ABC transporter permease [Caldilineaceae bacterium]